MVDTFVLSLGGSILSPTIVDTDFVKDFRQFILSHDNNFVIITGGGSVAREYQHALREVGVTDHAAQDWVGIMATRLNAVYLAKVLGGELIPEFNPELVQNGKLVIGAGYEPGHSSDMDAVLVAEKIGAKAVVNLSNIKQVYTSDPRMNPDAKPITEIGWDDFLDLLPTEWKPGLSSPFDPIAARKAKEIGIEVAIINGKDLDSLNNYINGKKFTGTIVKH
jgi:uridylate kinase